MMPGGIGELIIEIMHNIDADEIVLFGYSWGASSALRVGVKLADEDSRLKRIIAFMPTYQEDEAYKDELVKLRIPTLILWVKLDLSHNYRQSRAVNGPLGRQTEVVLLDIKNTQKTCENIYEPESDTISRAMGKFLLGKDPSDDCKVTPLENVESDSKNNIKHLHRI
jgi:hypothetical protein